MSDDRQYRQRGYQDSGPRERTPRGPRPPAEKPEFRTPNVPGFRQVSRCARCGAISSGAIDATSRCAGCGAELRTCAQCESFDPGSRFECQQTIPARVTPKDTTNACPLFAPRVATERETGSAAPKDARSAFDDLFK